MKQEICVMEQTKHNLWAYAQHLVPTKREGVSKVKTQLIPGTKSGLAGAGGPQKSQNHS